MNNQGAVPTLNGTITFSGAYWAYANSASLPINSSVASTLWETDLSDPSGGGLVPTTLGANGNNFSLLYLP